MKETVLLTGAAGFIGAATAKYLLKKNFKVVVVVRKESDLWRIQSIKKDITVVRADLTNFKQVDKLFVKFKPKYVIHLATHGVYAREKGDRDRIILGNYQMTYNLLEAASALGTVQKFINSGSVFEYGSQYGRVKETDIDITDVINDYSATKFATTALASSYYDKLSIITLRYFTAYGPCEDESRFIRKAITNAIGNEQIEIAPNVIRDFIFVDDIADGIYKSLSAPTKSEVINIGSGEKHTLEQVATLIVKQTNSKSKIILNNKYKRDKDSACWADIKKAAKLLKWNPKTTIAKGIKETVEWLAIRDGKRKEEK